jgi:hypothetical protein
VKPIVYRGTTFPCLTSLCAELGIPVQRVETRLLLGWSVDDAIDVPLGAGASRLSAIAASLKREFRESPDEDLRAALAQINLVLDRRAASQGQKPARPEERTVERPARRPSFGGDTPVTFRGETKTVREWSNEIGISVPTIARRLFLGWTVERALSTPPGKRRGT